jgi:hypothetical protein
MKTEPLTKEQLDKLESVLSKEKFDFLKQQFENQLNLFPEETKLIDCPHEIVFGLNINVLEQNEEGLNIGSKEISSKTYHIPVPTGVHYEDYVNTFVDFFEQAMIHAANQTDKQILDPNKRDNNE